MRIFTKTCIALIGMVALTGSLSVAPSAGAFTYEMIISNSSLVKKGRDLLYRGELDQAVAMYQRALETNLSRDDEHRANNDLCVTYFFKREFDLAIDYCNVAIDLVPNRWKPYNNRGNIYLELGNLEQAVADYDKGLKMLPSSEVLAANRLLAQQRAGDVEMMLNAENTRLFGDGWTDEDDTDESQKFIAFAGF